MIFRKSTERIKFLTFENMKRKMCGYAVRQGFEKTTLAVDAFRRNVSKIE